jgi:hypothetical protein
MVITQSLLKPPFGINSSGATAGINNRHTYKRKKFDTLGWRSSSVPSTREQNRIRLEILCMLGNDSKRARLGLEFHLLPFLPFWGGNMSR